ncbi:unnamed protein product [Paramecium sonneborni]|uniref:Transmembrane protein n=1 Tax=Paramecium sonneborni TaxID=65129 RepID=A0A8S1QWN4_9CILI|nr:unnamed protein product [Paramecium sonneborni]
MQQRSFGYIDIDNSDKNEAWIGSNKENTRNNKKIKRLMTTDFSNFEKMNFKQIKEENPEEFRPQTLKEMVIQAKLRFIETTPNSIIRRQEQQTIPFYIKQRDDQVKKVKSFKSPNKEQNAKEEDYHQKVCIFLIGAFLVIFLILIATELFIRKYLQ